MTKIIILHLKPFLARNTIRISFSLPPPYALLHYHVYRFYPLWLIVDEIIIKSPITELIFPFNTGKFSIKSGIFRHENYLYKIKYIVYTFEIKQFWHHLTSIRWWKCHHWFLREQVTSLFLLEQKLTDDIYIWAGHQPPFGKSAC